MEAFIILVAIAAVFIGLGIANAKNERKAAETKAAAEAYRALTRDRYTEAGTTREARSYRGGASSELDVGDDASRLTASQAWVAPGQSRTVQGRVLNGMVYVGTPPRQRRYGYEEKSRAFIDPSLPVSKRGDDRTGAQLPYWPGYSDIPPICRATYLDWLANGASDASYNAGYMFLYFYGLERRFFLDEPAAEEKRFILAEVRRLADLYSESHSARRYLSEFISVAEAATTPFDEIEPIYENPGWDLPFSIKLAVGARLERGETLGAEWVLSWFLCHPEKALRTPARRCRNEFIALFKKHFAARFPNGLKVNRPRRTLDTAYEAASREFSASVTPTVDGKPVPDIASLRKPVEIAQEIADEAMSDLEKFSRYLGRHPDGRGSVEAHALLPLALRDQFPSKEFDALKSWAEAVVSGGGLVPICDVLERLEGERPSKIGKRQLTGAADALARLGFGLAPDPRFGLRSPRENEPVVLFELGGPVEQLEDVSSRFRASLIEIALGSFVAHADGNFLEAERKSLGAHIEAVDGVSDHERRRLRANLAWFLSVPPDMPLLRRRLKEVGESQQAALRAALISASHADGVVQPEEVTEIEKVYRALGLDPDLVYSDLHAGAVNDAPVSVRSAQPGSRGEAIPEEEKPKATLDGSRIKRIRADTDRVSAVLAEIFTEADDEPSDENSALTVKLSGLDDKHTALVRDILQRPHWSEDDFVSLTKKHGLLAAGALETINEWSFGAFDEALLDEYDGYDVSQDVADALADEFEKENQHV